MFSFGTNSGPLPSNVTGQTLAFCHNHDIGLFAVEGDRRLVMA